MSIIPNKTTGCHRHESNSAGKKQGTPETPINHILSRLDGVRETGRGQYLARCPAHDDGKPSLSIRESQSGSVLCFCFAACPTADVLAAIGLEMADLFPHRDHIRPASRYERRVRPLDTLAAIDHEVLVVLAVVSDIRQQRTIDGPTWQRLITAATRIGNARSLYS